MRAEWGCVSCEGRSKLSVQNLWLFVIDLLPASPSSLFINKNTSHHIFVLSCNISSLLFTHTFNTRFYIFSSSLLSSSGIFEIKTYILKYFLFQFLCTETTTTTATRQRPPYSNKSEIKVKFNCIAQLQAVVVRTVVQIVIHKFKLSYTSSISEVEVSRVTLRCVYVQYFSACIWKYFKMSTKTSSLNTSANNSPRSPMNSSASPANTTPAVVKIKKELPSDEIKVSTFNMWLNISVLKKNTTACF